MAEIKKEEEEWECVTHGKIALSRTYPSYLKNRIKWCIKCSQDYVKRSKTERPWMRAWRTLARQVKRKTGQSLRWKIHGLPIFECLMDQKETVNWTDLKLEWCPGEDETFSVVNVHIVYKSSKKL